MSEDRESLADQAAAWVPPWARSGPERPPDAVRPPTTPALTVHPLPSAMPADQST